MDENPEQNATVVAEREGDRLMLGGELTVADAVETEKLLQNAFASAEPPHIIDLSRVTRLDTVGAWMLHKAVRDHPDVQIDAELQQTRDLLRNVAAADNPIEIHKDDGPFLYATLSRLGEYIVEFFSNAGGILNFIGLTTASAWRALRGKVSGFNFNAVIVQMEQSGINALGIIGLMTFLIGIVIAQQGAYQLQQFGAEVYVINLIGRLTFRELGILIAAIMVAGRSASAFAAQIGSMKLAEEIDAMRTMGLDPMQVLVLPRVFGLVLMMPLLNFFSCMCALVGGGLFVWVSLGMPPSAYVERLREVVPMSDFWNGMVKAPVFAAIIAIIGCYQGFQVSGNAESVGQRTTTAVVQSIFMVIVLDAFFAVFFSSIGF